MFKRKRARNLAVLAAVFALTAGASLVQGQPAKASGLPYAEAVYREASLGKTWCITADGSSAGNPVVLGKCAGAATQLLIPIKDTSDAYELEFKSSGLCITYPDAQGHADGVKAEEGKCIDDVSQQFYPGADAVGDLFWYLPVQDNIGASIAINDAGGVLQVYNPINSSYIKFPVNSSDDTVASEDFGGPDCLPNENDGGSSNC